MKTLSHWSAVNWGSDTDKSEIPLGYPTDVTFKVSVDHGSFHALQILSSWLIPIARHNPSQLMENSWSARIIASWYHCILFHKNLNMTVMELRLKLSAHVRRSWFMWPSYSDVMGRVSAHQTRSALLPYGYIIIRTLIFLLTFWATHCETHLFFMQREWNFYVGIAEVADANLFNFTYISLRGNMKGCRHDWTSFLKVCIYLFSWKCRTDRWIRLYRSKTNLMIKRNYIFIKTDTLLELKKVKMPLRNWMK